MDDWRLNGQEKNLSNATLYKVKFPEFWKRAYETKNSFYQKIAAYAHAYVQETGRWAELLAGENVQLFWHTHCTFCWEKAVTNEPAVFYCTKDMKCWVCSACFQDFCKQFHWQAKSAEDLFGQED